MEPDRFFASHTNAGFLPSLLFLPCFRSQSGFSRLGVISLDHNGFGFFEENEAQGRMFSSLRTLYRTTRFYTLQPHQEALQPTMLYWFPDLSAIPGHSTTLSCSTALPDCSTTPESSPVAPGHSTTPTRPTGFPDCSTMFYMPTGRFFSCTRTLTTRPERYTVPADVPTTPSALQCYHLHLQLLPNVLQSQSTLEPGML